MPFEARALACCWTIWEFTRLAKLFQEFHPIGAAQKHAVAERQAAIRNAREQDITGLFLLCVFAVTKSTETAQGSRSSKFGPTLERHMLANFRMPGMRQQSKNPVKMAS